MARILAGHFQLQEQIEQARRVLVEAGFPAGRISVFYVNQPGQHDWHAPGGERDRSPGAAAPRHAGMLLALTLGDAAEEARALSLLRGLGAEYLERAEGDIVDGDWCDFDPLATPRLLP